MIGLFYSTSEKILFYIPDYYTNGTGMLAQLKLNLQEGEDILAQFDILRSDIYAREIYKSSRYKGMWCFSAKLDKCPESAFPLNESWTMYKWIEN